MSEERWRAIADVLAASMAHSEGGICTLTDREHNALGRYQAERRRERSWVRSWTGFAGGLDAFIHRHREGRP